MVSKMRNEIHPVCDTDHGGMYKVNEPCKEDVNLRIVARKSEIYQTAKASGARLVMSK